MFALKDVERLSVKKGIVQQTVKDVLQSLVVRPPCAALKAAIYN